MQPFVALTGVAAPLPLANVDTDKVVPSRFLKTLTRTGLGRALFADLRYDEAGAERPDFVLNRPAYREAEVLIALENFGCGSSREHAPWALVDFGVRCVIAPSFADIFYNNALKNGLLPIRLPREVCEALMADAELGANARVTVDLERQVVVRATGETIGFDIDPMRRERLLHGLDDIAETLRSASAIDAYEAHRHAEQPWAVELQVG